MKYGKSAKKTVIRRSKLSKRNQRSIAPLVGTVIGLGALGVGGYKYFSGSKNDNVIGNSASDHGLQEEDDVPETHKEKCRTDFDIQYAHEFKHVHMKSNGTYLIYLNEYPNRCTRLNSGNFLNSAITSYFKKNDIYTDDQLKNSSSDLSLPLDNSIVLSRPIIKADRRIPSNYETVVPNKIPDFIKYGVKQPEMKEFEKEMKESNKRRISNEIILLEENIDRINERLIELYKIKKETDSNDPTYISTSNLISRLHSDIENLKHELEQFNSDLKKHFGSIRKRSRKVKKSRKKSRKVNKRRRSRK